VAPLVVLAAFLAGAIPFGLLLARRRGVDIRTQGSGNIGATNVARVLGLRDGLIVLALDAAKGALAVAIAERWCGLPVVVAAAGGAAIAGHCFSPFLHGRGGKGVATSLGVLAVLAPSLALVAVAVFAVIAGKTRVPALGSLSGVTAAAVFAIATDAPAPVRVLVIATSFLLVYTHRGNLARLTRS
jgi:glycerol-3-phosphate acyltransferase PlsY